MQRKSWSSVYAQALACWNWKCALLSATARSLVYLGAMAHSGSHGRLSVTAVEVGYVTVTAGLYAGLQQHALKLRSHALGNLIVTLGVPGLAQTLDWWTHRMAGAAAPARATVAVSIFTLVSALFHLHVMRRGVFLTGNAGRPLADDFRGMPRLILSFVLRPYRYLASFNTRPAESEPAL
jgi:MFS superfamily sulfate permease-like transporter